MRLLDVAEPSMVDLFADPLFHPHASAPRTAAESAIAALFHLDHSDPRNAIEHVPRFVEDSVVPSQVAGVVVGQELQAVLRGTQAARADGLAQHLAMVATFGRPAEAGIP